MPLKLIPHGYTLPDGPFFIFILIPRGAARHVLGFAFLFFAYQDHLHLQFHLHIQPLTLVWDSNDQRRELRPMVS